MSILKCAVIGVGYLGRFHAQKYQMLPEVELVAVCDANEKTCEQVATELNVPGFTNFRSLFGRVDAVSIASTTSQHFAIAKECLEQGLHVLLEKPMTETVEEADELIHLAKRQGLTLQVGHLERFNPVYTALKNELDHPLYIDAQRLAPFHFRGTDVNVVFDLMIHDIDLIQDLIQSPIVNIEAFGTSIMTDHIDIATVRLYFENLVVANLTASRVSYKRERTMRIFQRDNYLSVDFQNNQMASLKKAQQGVQPEIMAHEQKFEKADALLEQIKSFIHAIQHKTKPKVGGKEARDALLTAASITSLIQINLLNRQVHV